MFINKILRQYRRGRFIAPTADLSASDCPTILLICIIAPRNSLRPYYLSPGEGAGRAAGTTLGMLFNGSRTRDDLPGCLENATRDAVGVNQQGNMHCVVRHQLAGRPDVVNCA